MMTKNKAPLTEEQVQRIEQMRQIREDLLERRWRMVEVIQDLHARD